MEVVHPSTSSSKELTINDVLAPIIESRWLIASIVALFLLLGIAHVMTAQPIYQADALLQVEETSIGLDVDLSDLFQGEAEVSAEMEILKSRMVLGQVVDKLKLDYVSRPVRFPVLGGISARMGDSDQPKSPWFGLTKYAWGNEVIRVETFDVPRNYLGEVFTLVAGENGSYRLYDKEELLLIEGQVAEPEQVTLADDEPISLFVSELKARPGTHFELIRKPRLDAIDALRGSLLLTELGEESRILRISLTGANPETITTILKETANTYVRQNGERKSAEAEKSLAFLEDQLPVLKEQLENAEATLNSYRLKQGSVDLPMETQAILDKIVDIEAQISQLDRERKELLLRFTPRHPRLVALDTQIASLKGDLQSVNGKVKNLPDTQQEILRLSRDVQVNTELYTELLNKAQELRVVKAGTVGNVRIVDHAETPFRPVKPKKQLLMALYTLLGILVSVGVALLRKALLGRVEDPDVVEKQLGLPVYAMIPHSKKQDKLNKEKHSTSSALAYLDSEDIAIESLRSLRTSLHFVLLEAKSNVIMITGPRERVGKSFITANLGALLASSNKRVLVVDGDLRKGHLNDYFGAEQIGGLSDLIAGVIELKQAIQETGINNLSIISRGTAPPTPAELLMHERFQYVMKEVSGLFDYVIVDSPPVLTVTDAAIVGRLANVTLLVLKSGEHPLREIEQSAKRLKQAGVNLRGAIFNDMKLVSNYYGYERYYGYRYIYKRK